METLKKPTAQKYSEAIYGGREYVEKYQQKPNETYGECCARFYRERTGNGEYRNPNELTSTELQSYTPPIERKKKQSLADYKLKQLDYWLKHTKRTATGLCWYD